MPFLITLTSLLLCATSALASVKVIYGNDNRKDIYQVRSELQKTLAKSTAGMIHYGHFKNGHSRGILDLQYVSTLEKSGNICSSETFSQQLTAPRCSGFLVGPDTLVTAGHCFVGSTTPEEACGKYAWVFDYNMTSRFHNPTKNIPVSNVYLCKSVENATLTHYMDFAIIKLDRPVTGREPLNLRHSGKVSNRASLLVIGHPNGLPTKIATDGRVTENSGPNKFSTTLDTFQGNSGSPVFNTNTGLVEGILVQGKTDYVPRDPNDEKSCMIVNKCDDTGQNCLSDEDNGTPVSSGEVVIRITSILPQIAKALAK